MTFIGADGKPAPNLKDAKLNESQLENAFKQTFQIMIKLYRDCNLIHADLSEFNLLWHEHKVYCIDVSQSINTTHPMANKFLWRDCVNIHRVYTIIIHNYILISFLQKNYFLVFCKILFGKSYVCS